MNLYVGVGRHAVQRLGLFMAVFAVALLGCGLMVGCSSTQDEEASVTETTDDSGNGLAEPESEDSLNNRHGLNEPGSKTDDTTENDTADGQTASQNDDESVPTENAVEAARVMSDIANDIVAKDEAVIAGYLSDVYFDPTVYDITAEEFIDAFFDGVNCEVVDEYEASDGSVGVELRIVTRDGYQANELLGQAYQEAIRTGDALNCADVMSNVNEVVFDDPNYYIAYLVRDDDGTWQLENPAAFGAALLGGYDPRQLMD